MGGGGGGEGRDEKVEENKNAHIGTPEYLRMRRLIGKLEGEVVPAFCTMTMPAGVV